MERLFGDWSAGRGPIYARLAEAVRAAIERGDIPPGMRLPPERLLAETLAVSRTTVVLAYGRLRRRGLLESRQGSGTWVPRRAGVPSPADRREERGRSFLVDAIARAAADEPADTIGFLGACLPAAGDFLEEAWDEVRSDLQELARTPGYSPQGLPTLRRAIATSLEQRGLPTTPDEVLVTGGAQQAIDLVARFLVREGDAVVLEDPTYLGAIDAFTAARARLLPVPVGPAGPDVATLRRLAAEAAPALAYLVPSFHNPTGTLLDEGARREIARLAEAGLWVLEDESLADLSFGADPPPPIAAFAPRGSVLTVGSMSKLFWGGLRVGWVRGSRAVIARLARLKVVADLSGSVIGQSLAARLLPRREEVVRLRRRQLVARLERLTGLLREELPEWSWAPPKGGLSLWLRLPTPSAEDLARVAPRHGVSIVPGPVNSPSGGCADRVRLPFVLEERLLAEGVARLARAWRACREPAGERRLGVIV